MLEKGEEINDLPNSLEKELAFENKKEAYKKLAGGIGNVNSSNQENYNDSSTSSSSSNYEFSKMNEKEIKKVEQDLMSSIPKENNMFGYYFREKGIFERDYENTSGE